MVLFIFLLLFVGVFPLKEIIIFSVWFPNSEPGSDQGFLIKGGRGVIWHTDQNQRPLKRVEFMCGEMLPDLWRRLQMVLMWPNEWCTMEILFVWVMVCNMCVKEVLCGLHIYSSCCVRWTAMFARDLQWWCFAWLTRCVINSGYCVVVLWQCRGLTKVALWWIPLDYQWIVSDNDVKVADNESDVQGGEGRWWRKIVIVCESVQNTSDKSGSSRYVGSLVARVVQAYMLVVCQIFVHSMWDFWWREDMLVLKWVFTKVSHRVIWRRE